jgi:hypothetical protein
MNPDSVMSRFPLQALDEYPDFEQDGEDKEDDPDAMNDPINQVDLQAYLVEFLQTLSQQSCYPMFSQHHNDSERQILNMVGIRV